MATHQRILTKDRRRKKTGRCSLDSHNSSKPDRDGWFTAVDKSQVDNTIDLDLLPPKKKPNHNKRKRIHDSSSDDDGGGGGGSDNSRDAWGNKSPSKVSTRRIINKVNKRSKKKRQLQLSSESESEESNDDDEDNSVVFVAKETSRDDKSRRLDKGSSGKAKGQRLKPSESKKTKSKSGLLDRKNLARLRRSIDSAGERHTELSHNAAPKERGCPLPAKAQATDRIMLPGSIDTVDQLVWYRMVLQDKPDEYEARYKLTPCRILEGDEAERQRRNLRADSNLTIVQYMHWRDPSKGKYRALSRDQMVDFAKKSSDGISYTFNDEYLNRYLRQELSSDHNKKAEERYLLGLYRHAVEEERRARQLAEKERQAFCGSSSEESEAKVRTKKVAAKKKTARKGASIAKKSARKKDVQFELVEVQQCESEQDEESDQDDDAMDIPYTQAMNYDSDDFDFGSEDEKSNEPLRPGDVIEYYSGIYVAGDPRGHREATVMAVKNPKEEFPLVLDNGECIPNTTRVKRIKEMVDGELIDHPGIYREIMKFRLKKSGTATAADGVAKEAERFGRIMDRNMAKLKKKAEADGFAPMDMLVGLKGTKKGSSTKNNRPNESSSSEQDSSSSSEDSSSDESLDAKLKARSQTKRPVKFLPKKTGKKKSINKENNRSKPSTKTDRNMNSRDELSFASSSADESESFNLEKNPKALAVRKSTRTSHPKSADLVDLSTSESDDDPQSAKLTSGQRSRRKATLDDSSSSDDESSLETPKQRKASPTGPSTDSIKRRIKKGAPRGSSARRARESQSSARSSLSRLSRPSSPPSSDDSLSLRALAKRSSARKHRSGSKAKPGKKSDGMKSRPSPTIDLSSDDESECSIPKGIAFSRGKKTSPARKQSPSRRKPNSARKPPSSKDKMQKQKVKPNNSKQSEDDDSDSDDFGMTQKSFAVSFKINRNK